MNFKVLRFTSLRELPSPTATEVEELFADDLLESIDSVAEQGGFIKVNLLRMAGASGWVLKDAIVATKAPPRPALNIGGFVRNCIAAERACNRAESTAPWFVSADFLIARAIIETKLKNEGPLGVNKDGVGPLQVSSEEWKIFRDEFNTAASKAETHFEDDGFKDAARDNPISQIRGAAARMIHDAKAMSELRRAAGIGTATDSFVPSYLDLFHAYLANSPKAALAVRDAAAGTPIKDVLKTVLSEAELKELIDSRSRDRADPGTVGDIVKRTEAALNDALKQAAALIAQHAPDEVAIIPQAGGAAAGALWMVPARKELADGVTEGPTHNARIVSYFKHTDISPRPANVVAWCGAFAAHCMSESGNDLIEKNIPPGAALAVSWKQWGVSIPAGGDIPEGAVVVLSPSPPTTGGTGHVGFFLRRDGNSVVLLGGNQGHRVSETRFPASLIAKVCWFTASVDTTGIPDGPQTVGPLGPNQWDKYRDVLGMRESTNTYSKVNQFNYIGRWQFGAAALNEVGYVHPRKKNRDLLSPGAWIGKDGITSQTAWLGNHPVQDAAMLAFTRIYYKRLIKFGALPANATVPRAAGMLAVAHLLGPGGALNFSRGINSADGNGTTAKSYYKLLSQALGGSGIYPG